MKGPRLALVTSAANAGLLPDDRELSKVLAARGWRPEPAVWDDPRVEWRGFDAALIRTPWDYHLKPAAFRAWLERLEGLRLPLWNPAPVVRANMDKSYLRGLATAGVSVAETEWVPAGGAAPALAPILARRGWQEAVVKPVVSAGAFRTRRVAGGAAGDAALAEVLEHSDAMVQPFLPEIADDGEWSLIFLGGEFSHAVVKSPAKGDFRVQEEHGGRTGRREAPESLVADARAALAACPGPLVYARVDGVNRRGRLVIVEVELIEPFLFLSYAPGAVERLVAALESAVKASA